MRQGVIDAVTGWLAEHVHAEGARLTPPDLMKKATGKALTAAPALRYLESKYLEDER